MFLSSFLLFTRLKTGLSLNFFAARTTTTIKSSFIINVKSTLASWRAVSELTLLCEHRPRHTWEFITQDAAESRHQVYRAVSGSLHSFLVIARPNLLGEWDMEELQTHSSERSFRSTGDKWGNIHRWLVKKDRGVNRGLRIWQKAKCRWRALIKAILSNFQSAFQLQSLYFQSCLIK